MSAMIANFIYFLSHNLKSAKLSARLTPTHVLVTDVRRQTLVANRRPKRFQFFLVALSHEFHAAIRQIANRAGDFKTRRNAPDSISKTDALHVA